MRFVQVGLGMAPLASNGSFGTAAIYSFAQCAPSGLSPA
jgi:hypothetical protein